MSTHWWENPSPDSTSAWEEASEKRLCSRGWGGKRRGVSITHRKSLKSYKKSPKIAKMSQKSRKNCKKLQKTCRKSRKSLRKSRKNAQKMYLLTYALSNCLSAMIQVESNMFLPGPKAMHSSSSSGPQRRRQCCQTPPFDLTFLSQQFNNIYDVQH